MIQINPAKYSLDIFNYYINTNEIPSELSHENLISSPAKISPLLWLLNRSGLSHQKNYEVKSFGSSLVFIRSRCLYNK